METQASTWCVSDSKTPQGRQTRQALLMVDMASENPVREGTLLILVMLRVDWENQNFPNTFSVPSVEIKKSPIDGFCRLGNEW